MASTIDDDINNQWRQWSQSTDLIELELDLMYFSVLFLSYEIENDNLLLIYYIIIIVSCAKWNQSCDRSIDWSSVAIDQLINSLLPISTHFNKWWIIYRAHNLVKNDLL